MIILKLIENQFIWLYKRGFYFPAYSFDDRNDCLLSGLGSGGGTLVY